jgi:hypothetical protein
VAAGHTAKAQLFNPKDFQPKTKRLLKRTRALKDRNITPLNSSVASAVGILGKSLGLNRVDIKLEHLVEFVRVVVDG